MSAQSGDAERGRFRADYVLIGGVALLLLFAVFYVMSQRQQALRSSPLGFDGLRVWLASEGQSAQVFTGGWTIDPDSVGVLVVPLYDTDLSARREPPQTKEELLFQQDKYDLSLTPISQKRNLAQTLIVLPKWRSGMRLAKVGHPALWNDAERMTRLLRRLTGDTAGSVVRSAVPFVDFDGPGGADLRAKIYAAQLVRSSNCAPIVGTDAAMLLGRCSYGTKVKGQRDFLLLADPDLLNNHGLALGDNARVASALFEEWAEGKNVVIDYSASNWLVPERARAPRVRSWSDLGRFFSPPFTLLWLAGLLSMALMLWRAALRFGPVIETLANISASKRLAVAARARLMRLSDQDGAMLSDYAQIRIATLCAQIFGPARARHYASEEAFLRYVKRRRPELAEPLIAALNGLRGLPARIPTARALSQVDELEHILERISNDT